MNISFRIRREAVIAAAVLGLGLGGFTAPAAADAATSTGPGTATITDSVTTGPVTGKDSVLTCATTQIAIGGTEAVAVPVGCLTETIGDFVKVTWSGTGTTSTELTLQGDSNFVLYAGNGKTWGAATRAVDNPNGPGCIAAFQGDADLVVRNCALAAIWASGTHTYPNAVLAFQADGNLVIYSAASGGTALWDTGTY